MKRYVFLGLFYNPSSESNLISTSRIGLQNAANTFQLNFLDGLINNKIKPIIVNSPPIGTYPMKSSVLLYQKEKWHYKSCECIQPFLLNLPFIKMINRRISMYHELKKIISKYENDEIIVIAYSIYLPFLKILKRIHKNKKIKSVLIVPDLPGKYGIVPKPFIKKILYYVYGHIELKYIKYVSYFVLLTEKMKEPLKINDNYVVVEGFSREKALLKNINNNKKCKALLYTGTLDKQFGIVKLVKAFLEIECELELWICGEGDSKDFIINACKKDKRIKYMGYLPSDKIQELQQQAMLLINPREDVGEYTKYSFPSKTLEYMSTGTAVLMHKLSGIDNEYYKYVYIIEKNDIVNLRKTIIKIAGYGQKKLIKKGSIAKEFVLKNKNPKVQVKKIIDMVEKNELC